MGKPLVRCHHLSTLTTTLLTATMKACLLLLAALTATALAANELELLMLHEVQELYKQEPHMSVQQCTDKCDAMFSLIAGHDEQLSDRACATLCDCIPKNDCQSHPHAPHHGNHHTNAPIVTAA